MQTLPARIRRGARVSGHFVLRSGVVSDTYFDKYQFESDPHLLRAMAQAMVPELALCVIDRQTGGLEALARVGLSLKSLFTFEPIERAC